MLEVVFDESTAGSLRQAKGRRQGQRTVSQGVAIYVSDGKGGEAQSKPVTVERVWGTALPGTAADVAPLVLALDMGDLSDLNTAEKAGRQALFLSLEGVGLPEKNAQKNAQKNVEWRMEMNRYTLDRLETARQTGEEIRVWMADWCPDDLCGLYFVCGLLRNADLPISVVRAPRERVRPDGMEMTVYRGMGEFRPEELGELAAGAVSLAPVQRRAYANRWQELVGENAPLRAVVNGRLMSVPEDHYDFVLRAALPETEPIKMGRLLGDALRTLTGVGDGWLYLRLRAMLAAGELRQVSPGSGEHPYSALVQKA